MNNYFRSIGEYLDDQFYAHPRMFIMVAIFVGFGLCQLFD
jgi:hypothetical protein